MHQSNLTGDRLGYPVMDGILSAYRAVYGASAPIVNLPMSGDGVVLHNQQLWATALRERPRHRLGAGQHGHHLRPAGHDGPGHGPGGNHGGIGRPGLRQPVRQRAIGVTRRLARSRSSSSSARLPSAGSREIIVRVGRRQRVT